MIFGNILPSHLNSLSLQQTLDLSNVYLENAYRTRDDDVALVLCYNAEAALAQAKRANRKHPDHLKNARYQALCAGVANAYIDLGKLMENRGYHLEARAICKKAQKWG